MRRRLLAGIAALFIFLGCALARANSQPPHNPQVPHCAQILFCLFDQEASTSDPAGIHKYSEDLIGLILPNPEGDSSIRRLTDQLADRLAKAEQAARAGDGKLVPEAAVVKAFNDLMHEIGAPPSMRTNEAVVHRFREHAASIKAFPALFSADRNGKFSNPGEAVFLFYSLLSGNGNLFEQDLDRAQQLTKVNPQGIEPGFLIAGMEPVGSRADRLLFTYVSRHGQNTAIVIFNKLATTLGF